MADCVGQLLKTLTGHSNNVFAVSFSPDGRQIVSGSEDRTLKVWDAQTGQMLQTIVDHKNGSLPLDLAPTDGKLFWRVMTIR